MIVLIIVSVLGTLAVSFMLLGTRDYQVSRMEEWGVKAFYIARCGIEYYGAHRTELPPGTTKRITFAGDGGMQYCDIEVREEVVSFTGVLATEDGAPLSQRTLKAPYGDTSRWYEGAR